MATKKSIPGTKTTRGRSDSISENPAPNPTVEPVKQPVRPGVQVAASTEPETGAPRTEAKTMPEVKAKPQVKAKSEAKAKPATKATASPAASEALSQGNGQGKPGHTKPENNKMFEVSKPEARKNVVPINLEEEIRRRAYELFLQRDPYAGSEADDWLNAEREVMHRYQQHSA